MFSITFNIEVSFKKKIFLEDKIRPAEPPIPRMKKRDMTLSELRKYDGINNPEGRVLVAVLGKIYDCTRGKRFYGPGMLEIRF